MDQVTQQNSALVEENAATAKTLEHQAKNMDERVAFFQLDDAAGNAAGADAAKSGAAIAGDACRETPGGGDARRPGRPQQGALAVALEEDAEF